jgi:hypothetical protein
MERGRRQETEYRRQEVEGRTKTPLSNILVA